ncbi:MAG: hypothetical protein UX71_C0013G0011 [Parcubacteria group bacterium GW2011_GWA1_47_10]|nr:MAG: hypothetical protein UX71_C0013G0011 [Parcubacteria group bacterium GW2011_GWA1_47_10]
MPKAEIKTKNGSVITVEGTQSEVAEFIVKFGDFSSVAVGKQKKLRLQPSGKTPLKASPVTLIAELIDGGFFKKPKGLGVIKIALEEHGHYYPVTTLSTTMLRFVRKHEVRRIKDKKRWLYVG